MKKALLSLGTLLVCGLVHGQSVFINEINYDTPGTDADESVEIAGPAGTDLSAYSLVFYNGNNGASYATLPLTGTLSDQSGCGYGVALFFQVGIQNGAPDGIALVEGASNVIQFLSYEGAMTAIDGPANGLTSTDIGVFQDGVTAGTIQLTGSGTTYTDFTWAPIAAGTTGQINNNQDFCSAPTPTVAFTVAAQSAAENAGTVQVTLNLNVAASGTQTVQVTITDNTSTYGSDYTSNPVGSAPFDVTFLTGVTSATIDINIINDGTSEAAEDFTLEITNVSAGLQIGGISTQTFTILDNDMPTTPIANVQATMSGDQSDVVGSTVTVGGRVSAIKTGSGFWIQDAPAAWSGIYVFDFGDNTVAIGDSVIVSGTVAEFAPGGSTQTATQLTTITYFSNEGANTPHAPLDLTTQAVNAEMYESVLVKVSDASCTAPIVNFNEYSVNDGSGAVVIDDFLYLTTPAPVVGNLYNITGVVTHNFQAYKILPRNVDDVELISGASVEEFEQNRISVYPNPSNEIINVMNTNGETIRVYNTLGQLVVTTKNPQISLKNGVYFVKVADSTIRVIVR